MERETKRIEERDRAAPPRRSEEPAGEQNPVALIAPEAAPAPSAPAPPPPAVAPLPQIPVPQARPRLANPVTTTLPPLPPPTSIRPAPIFPPPQ
jgi:hypothetical protein